MSDKPSLPAVRREIAVVHDTSSFANLLDTAKFEHIWRVANTFAASGMVPKIFANKPEACFVAIQMALRLEVDPMMFMQNTYLSPDGKPAMQAQLAISLVHQRGTFKGPLNYTMTGDGDTRACTASQETTGGQHCEITVSIKDAKAEGWYARNPKWKNLPDLMLRYRAGAWFARVYAPECLLGLPTVEEVQDMGTLVAQTDGTFAVPPPPPRPTRESIVTVIPDPVFFLVDFDGEEHGYPTAEKVADAFCELVSGAPTADALAGLAESYPALRAALVDQGFQSLADDMERALKDRDTELGAKP